MEYIDNAYSASEYKYISEYNKKMIFSIFFLLFRYNCFFSKLTHVDLHLKNWKLIKSNKNNFNYQIVIFDFGRVVKNNYQSDLNNITKYIDLNNIDKISDNSFNLLNNKENVEKNDFKKEMIFFIINILKI